MAVPRKLACGVNSRPTFAKSSHVEGAGLGSPFAKSNHVEGRGGHLGFLKFLLARKGRVQFVWNLNDGQRKLRALRGLRQ